MYEPRIVSCRTGKASGSSLREIMIDGVVQCGTIKRERRQCTNGNC